MSRPPLVPSPDIVRLVDEGHEVEIRQDYLLVHHVPYLDAQRRIQFGTLVVTLNVHANAIQPPKTHVIHFTGTFPHNRDGTPIKELEHAGAGELIPGLHFNHSFSHKPKAGYPDYYAQVTRYIEVIAQQAQAIDPGVTARTFKPLVTHAEDSVFHYLDTNATRAKIGAISSKVKGLKIAIVGVGGTGSYVLDLVAKTLVEDIHLFDRDKFAQHNAFRSPGAPSLAQLAASTFKVDYFAEIYARMRKNIHPHAYNVTAANVHELAEMDFVFICVDDGPAKKIVVDFLVAQGKPFIDVGLGVQISDGKLMGIVRTTTSTPEKRDHIDKVISFAEAPDDVYHTNIQIAELNMWNAAMAVVKWKKLYGIYDDAEREHDSTYTINVNMLLSDD